MDRMAAMETFVRVVEAGSFSSAARALQVGQPAVSKTVAQLEDRLSVRLLLRSARGLTPTEAGQAFYEKAKRSIEEADEADRVARGAGATLTGKLRFSAPVTLARLHVFPRLPLFLAAHPTLRIDAILDDRRVDLIEEGIDVALRVGTPADSTMTARKVGHSRRLMIGTPAYLARAGEPTRPEELAEHDVIHYAQPGGGATWTFRQDRIERTVATSGSISVNAAEGVREAVLAGLGLCIATEWMFAAELRDGQVRQVLGGWELPATDLWALFPTGNRPSAKAKIFAGFVADQLSETSFGLMRGGRVVLS